MTVVRPSSSMITVVPRSSPAAGTAVTCSAFSVEQRHGDVAETSRERADELGRGLQRQRRPAHVDRLAARRHLDIGGAQNVTGAEGGEPDRAVDRLVQADDDH